MLQFTKANNKKMILEKLPAKSRSPGGAESIAHSGALDTSCGGVGAYAARSAA